MNRAATALRWSSLSPTPHSLLTSHDRRDKLRWTKTALKRTVQFARRRHDVSMLKREGEQLVVEESMTEIVRPVLEVTLYELGLRQGQQQLLLQP